MRTHLAAGRALRPIQRRVPRPAFAAGAAACCAALALAPPVFAAAEGDAGVMAWGTIAVTLLGGLALFLFGLDMMAEALSAVAGDRMRMLLARLTTNPLAGAATGAAVTAAIQSSTVTTVLVVGFIAANVLTLEQGVGVIIGANVGTTVTAQIIAFDLGPYALLVIALGFVLRLPEEHPRLTGTGSVLLGMGVLFFGMELMGRAMEPLRAYPAFVDLMRHAGRPLVGVAVGAVFTALVQSSAATAGIVIVLARQQLMTLPAAIGVILGANIGTCLTAVLASFRKSPDAVRAALVHVLFNVIGVLLWVGFVDQLAWMARHVTPSAYGANTAGQGAESVAREIANAHMIFNLVNALIFVGFAKPLAAVARRLVPEPPPHKRPMVVQPEHLDPGLLETPPLALEAARREVKRMGARVGHMLEAILPALLAGERDALRAVARLDNDVDRLHGFIIDYLGGISRQQLTEQQTQELLRFMEAVNDLENMGDVIETDLVLCGLERLDLGVKISAQTQAMLRGVHELALHACREAVEAVTELDVDRARAVIDMKTEMNNRVDEAYAHQARRLVAAEPGRVSAYKIEISAVEKLKHIYYYAKRMAKVVVPGELPPVPGLAGGVRED